METYYTVDDLAKMFKVNVMTVYRLIEKGKIKYTKFGGSIRISEDNLKEYLNKKSE